MNKQTDAGSSGGLLSKMVKFVRSPTTQWSDLDRAADRHSKVSESRLALKAVMERKRQNDFVRNREFDELRRLRRQSGRNSVAADLEPAAGSYPEVAKNTEGRAKTLAKINSLEKLMVPPLDASARAPQTAQAAQPAAAPAAAHAAASAPAAMPVPPLDPVLAKERAKEFAPTLPIEQMLEPADSERAPATLGLGSVAFSLSAPAVDPGPSVSASANVPQAPAPAPAPKLLGDVPFFNVEVVATAKHDPEIEEAAIRFANGDDAGAESGLLALLGEGGSRRRDVDTWLTLFDFYRCTDQSAKFDDAAMDFVGLFGRSAPQWAISAEVHGSSDAQQPPLGTAQALGTFHWVSPVALSAQSLVSLRTTLLRSAPPWKLNWQPIKSIEPDALPVMIELFKSWAGMDVRLKFLGLHTLLDLLAEYSPNGDRSVDTRWWDARLALLRVVGGPDEFDLVALDYCMTYEVSPPAWEAPKNSFNEASADGNTIIGTLLDDDSPGSQQFGGTKGATSSYGRDWDPYLGQLTLEGEHVGSASEVVARLREQAEATSFEINCRRLRRVDFGAAGDLLNWALEQQGKGYPVSFKQVNRLVAAFFGVIGITDAARVVLRVD